MSLSDTQISEFRADGFTLVPNLFSEQECDRIAADIEKAVFELELGDEADGQLSYRPMMHLLSPALQKVAADPRWAGIVPQLLGELDVRLYWEQAVAKPPHATTVLPWHQDNGYTPLVPEQYLTCWLALDDATIHNGCLWVMPSSHVSGTLPHHNDEKFGPFRVGHVGPDSDGVPVPVGKGSVLAFSSLLMHRSGPNTTGDRRLAWILQYCGTGARSALSDTLLDDRLRLSRNGEWLETPERERDFDLDAVLANYDQR